MKIAVVQKCPSNINYERSLGLSPLDIYNLSSQKVSRLLKRDIDLVDFSPEAYDWVILIGSEAVKQFSKATSVTDYTGKVLPGKNDETNLIACISPAMMAFKPETRPVFEASVQAIQNLITGKTKPQETVEIKPIVDLDEALEYLTYCLNLNRTISLDSETSALSNRDGHILGISVSHKKNQGVYIHGDLLDGPVVDVLAEIIYTRPVVFHNAKFDMKWFSYHLNIDFSKAHLVHDTMVMHYLLDERQGTHGLKSLTMKYGSLGDYDRPLEEFKDKYCKSHGLKKGDFSYDLIPFDVIWPYAAKDTAATLELLEKFLPIIERNPKLKKCYYELMLPSLMFLTKVEERGVPISSPRLNAARNILMAELDDLYDTLYSYEEVRKLESEQGAKFNPNSTAQLRKLFFDHIKLPIPTKMTATGNISTDAEVLQDLALMHKVPDVILKIRKSTKLINTYIDKLLRVIDIDDRVRTGFNLTSTTSGRLSSSGNFNMQQLPRDNPLIKGAVKARPGYKIVAVDLTTAEVYYAAVLSGDANLRQVFINMKKDPVKYPDFHGSIAHMVFNLPCEPAQVKKLYPALRQAAKAITFGILYGSGPSKVAESVNAALMEEGKPATCDVEQAKEYISTYYARFPRLKKWISECHSMIKTDGFIYSHFGRKRRLHNVNSADRGIAAGEVRSGFNAIIQSVSSDSLLIGAVEADIELLEKGLDAQIFALVHDSIVAEVKEDQVDEYLAIIRKNIQRDRGCSIPNCPIGLEEDTQPGGSVDYSGGKLDKLYPEVAEW